MNYEKMQEKTFTQVDARIEIVKLIIDAIDNKLPEIRALFPDCFVGLPKVGSLEYTNDVNTSYLKWIEDYGITRDWIGDFPTSDIYHNYIRYCNENRYPSMSKRDFYRTIEIDFNLTERQRADGLQYFIGA